MFKKIINSCLLIGVIISFSFNDDKDAFKNSQLKNQRVKTAYQKKWPWLLTRIRVNGIEEKNFDVYLRVFKHESLLEVYVKSTGDEQFQLLKTIPICAKSGTLGPKRKQGDLQVPEGFYDIASFNPNSTYYLALQVGYPNKSDRLKSVGDPGGEIMIHGECVTIGCIPLQNDPIEEVYVLCVEAKNRGRVIHTDIYPYQFANKNTAALEKNYDAKTIQFWNSLKKAYDYFETNQRLPKITIDKTGNYVVESI